MTTTQQETICTSCQLARMLERGVVASSADAGHSSCEGTHEDPCSCGCPYSKWQACRECGRKGTPLDEHGACVDKTDCANAIYARVTAEREAREARAAAAPPKRSKSLSAAGKGDCKCGCGEKTGGGLYRPGHDARHVSQLVAKVKAGDLALHDAVEEVAHSQKLQDKLRKAVGVE